MIKPVIIKILLLVSLIPTFLVAQKIEVTNDTQYVIELSQKDETKDASKGLQVVECCQIQPGKSREFNYSKRLKLTVILTTSLVDRLSGIVSDIEAGRICLESQGKNIYRMRIVERSSHTVIFERFGHCGVWKKIGSFNPW